MKLNEKHKYYLQLLYQYIKATFVCLFWILLFHCIWYGYKIEFSIGNEIAVSIEQYAAKRLFE